MTKHASPDIAQIILVAIEVFSRFWTVRGRRELSRTNLDSTLKDIHVFKVGEEVAILSEEGGGVRFGRQRSDLVNARKSTGRFATYRSLTRRR